MKRNFSKLLKNRWNNSNTLLCIGLDPDYPKIPHFIKRKYKSISEQLFEFNKSIIDATQDLVCCYKAQYAFYASFGQEGLLALQKTIAYIQHQYSNIPVILDSKRGDIGNTAVHYAIESFDIFKADAMTINPYLGFDSLEPFLKYKDKGIIILCRTSNKSAQDFQDIVDKKSNLPLYQLVAQLAKQWNINQNISLVIGATYPDEMKQVREFVGDEIPFLIPGLGAQGGKPKDIINGFNKNKTGIMANSSRGIIFASNKENFAKKARKEAMKLKDEINKYR